MVFGAAACTSVQVGDGDGGVSHHFGYVRIVKPKTQGLVVAHDVSSLGIALENGVHLGWRSREEILSDPRGCILLVIIKTGMAFDNAIAVLNGLKGDDLCVVSYGE